MAIKNLGRVVGLSAYEIWLQQGNEGTEQDYLDSLKGEKGADGKDGVDGHTPIKGEDYFTEEEVNAIKSECKQQVVVGDVTEASIMMADNVNVQLTEPLTQLFLEFPEEIEIGYRSEITFTMNESDMTFYPDLEYDGDIAWYGQYVSDGRPYISLGSKYHIVFTYDVNGMKAVINGEEMLNETELTKNKVTEITEENREDDYPNVDAVKNYVDNAINGIDVPGILNIDIRNMDFIEPDTELYNKIRDFTYSDETTAKIILAKQSDYNNDVTMEYIYNNAYYKGIYYNGAGIWEIVLRINNSGNRFSVSRSWSQILTVNGNQSYNVSNNNTPANKKYVDDAIAAIPEAKTIEEQGLSFMDLESLNLLGTSSSYTITKNSDMWNKLQELTFGTGLEHVAIITQISHARYGIFYGRHQGTSPNDMYQFNCDYIFEQQGSDSSLNNYKYYFYIQKGISYGGTNDNDISIKREEIGILTKGNTKSYTVSSNYNPAHKKYVDDAIAAQVGNISTILETLTTVSEVSE